MARKREMTASKVESHAKKPRLKKNEVSNSAGSEKSFIGQQVSGTVDGSFDAGFLLTVKVGDSPIILRGLVFEPGLSIPLSNGNDIAPKVGTTVRDEHVVIPPGTLPTVNSGSVVESSPVSKSAHMHCTASEEHKLSFAVEDGHTGAEPEHEVEVGKDNNQSPEMGNMVKTEKEFKVGKEKNHRLEQGKGCSAEALSLKQIVNVLQVSFDPGQIEENAEVTARTEEQGKMGNGNLGLLMTLQGKGEANPQRDTEPVGEPLLNEEEEPKEASFVKPGLRMAVEEEANMQRKMELVLNQEEPKTSLEKHGLMGEELEKQRFTEVEHAQDEGEHSMIVEVHENMPSGQEQSIAVEHQVKLISGEVEVVQDEHSIVVEEQEGFEEMKSIHKCALAVEELEKLQCEVELPPQVTHAATEEPSPKRVAQGGNLSVALAESTVGGGAIVHQEDTSQGANGLWWSTLLEAVKWDPS